MAATPKGPSRIQLDWYIDREAYNNYVRACSSKGFAPQVVVERLMRKYSEGLVQV